MKGSPTKEQIVEELFSPRRTKDAMAKFVSKWGLDDTNPEKSRVYTDISLIQGEGNEISKIAARIAEDVLAKQEVQEFIQNSIASTAPGLSESMAELVARFIYGPHPVMVDKLNEIVLQNLNQNK